MPDPLLKCLICCKDTVSHSKRTEIHKNGKLPDQVRVIFIFRKLLQIPASLCGKFLSSKGNPSEWTTPCCFQCSLLVDQAFFLQQQVNQLQKRLNRLGVTVRNEIRQNYKPPSVLIPTRARRSAKYSGTEESVDIDVIRETQAFICQQDSESDNENYSKLNPQLHEVFDETPMDMEQLNVGVDNETADPLSGTDPLGDVELTSPSPSPVIDEALDLDIEVKEEAEDYKDENNQDDNNEEDEDYNMSERDSDSSDEEFTISNTGTKAKPKVAKKELKSATKSSSNAETDFQCDICEKFYKDAKALRHHRKNLHNIYAEQERDWSNAKTARHTFKVSNNPEKDKTDSSNAEISKPMQTVPVVYKRTVPYRKLRRHCEVCDSTFKTLNELFKHRKAAHNLNPLGQKPPLKDRCEVCNLKFPTYETLRRHRLRVHDIRERVYRPMKKPETRWKCCYCMETFVLDTERDEHEINVHGKEPPAKPFDCLVCARKFRDKNELALHYDIAHKPPRSESKAKASTPKPFLCEKCPPSTRFSRFATEEELNHHDLRVHVGDEKPYKCSVCKKGHTSSFLLRKHMQIHTGVRNYACDICEKRFSCSTLVAYHKLREHDGGEDNPLQCNICRKVFSTKTYLRLHQDTVHLKKFRHFCEKCGQGFQSLSNLRTHLRIHENPKPRKKYKRRKENKNLDLEAEIRLTSSDNETTTESLQNLIKSTKPDDGINAVSSNCESSNFNNKILRCQQCPKGRRRKYTNEEDLQRHVLKYHEGDKTPFKCQLCAKGFHSQGSLQIHMQTHTGERLFPCDLCDQKFTSSTYLTYHKNREHPEEGKINPLQCDICDKILASVSNLRMHKASLHEKTFKFSCTICGQGFQTNGYLKNHMKKHETNRPRKQYTYKNKPAFPEVDNSQNQSCESESVSLNIREQEIASLLHAPVSHSIQQEDNYFPSSQNHDSYSSNFTSL